MALTKRDIIEEIRTRNGFTKKKAIDVTETLIELIKASPQIKAVCAGHVHQEFEGRIGSAAIYTTPSTCVQFGARTEKSFDTKAAGYRLLQLDDDCHTQVHRLSDDYKGVGDK